MIQIHAFSNNFIHCSTAFHVDTYDLDICMGECIRSLCVNLRIDPDTCDGITRNIVLYVRDVQSITDSSSSISDLLHQMYVCKDPIPLLSITAEQINLNFRKCNYDPYCSVQEFCNIQNLDMKNIELFIYYLGES